MSLSINICKYNLYVSNMNIGNFIVTQLIAKVYMILTHTHTIVPFSI